MFNPALKSNNARQAVSRARSTPAPVRGWNAYDSLASMKSDEAVILDNWFPKESEVEARKGSQEHVTGMSTQINTLFAYENGTTKKLFAAETSDIYDVTSAGAVGAAVVSSLTNGKWQYINFGTSGGQFIVAVNGADAEITYDGTTWGGGGFTGTTGDEFINITTHKSRIFLVKKDSLKFGYLAVNAIAGAVSEFDLAPLCKHGGHLKAVGSWSLDAGDGVDDLAVFITSNGEVIIYKGDDPSTAADWALVGVYKIGSPLSYRCFIDYGGDLIVMTEDGFDPLSQVITKAQTDESKSLSRKIQGAVRTSTAAYRANYGWEAKFYTRGGMVLFNVPVIEDQESVQYVMNSTTKAWCRFTGWNASCFAVHNGDLYFGTENTVYQADIGETDNAVPITSDGLTAFNYFGSGTKQKAFKLVRPIIKTDITLAPALSINVDHKITEPVGTPTFSIIEGSPWDSSPWDTTSWGSISATNTDWIGVGAVGYCGAIRMKIARNNGSVAWIATDWVLEDGGFL